MRLLERHLSTVFEGDRTIYSWQLFQHKLDVLLRHRVQIPDDAMILDYCCGEGDTVQALVDHGFHNAHGYDVEDYVKSSDKSRFGFGVTIPFANDSFDLVMSDQVFEHVQDQEGAFREIYRVLKPGGVSMHVIPARYQLIEPHIFVPLGGLIRQRWWFKFWAKRGIRNPFQDGMSANEVADVNTYYTHYNLKYVGNLEYRAMWKRVGFEYRFAERDYMETSHSSVTRKVARLSPVLPVAWAARQFIARIPVLRKPH